MSLPSFRLAIIKLLLTVATVMLMAPRLSAQSACVDCLAGPAVCNGTLGGFLEDTDCFMADDTLLDTYQLVLGTPSTVMISMNSDDFDCFLFLLNASCQVIAQNDDCSPGNVNSCVTATLAAGTYYVGANSFEPSEGSYSLTVTGCAETLPSLTIQRQASDVRISWPPPATDFVLVQSPTVNGTWSQVPFPYITNATDISVISPASVGNTFYRLRRP